MNSNGTSNGVNSTPGAAVVKQGLRISIRGTSASKPEDWKSVKKILKKKEYTKFSRTPEVAAAYEARAAKYLERYATIGDELQVRFFGALEAVDASGKVVATPAAANPIALVLSPNAFPYNLSKDIEHYVLWSREPTTLEPGNRVKQVQAVICSTLGIKKSDFLAYENPHELKSVPNIRHWQIFVKAKALGDHVCHEEEPITISNDAVHTVLAKLAKRKRIINIALFAWLLNPASGHM